MINRLLPLLGLLSVLWGAPALAQQVVCANDFTGCTNGTISPGGGGSSGGNPTATATGTAINGTATTYMRSDAAPAIRTAATGAVGLAAPANPSATAGSSAVNGSAVTFMRSDGAPAIQLGTAAQKGIVQCDGSTITCASGVISASSGGGTVTAVTCGTGLSGGTITASGTCSVTNPLGAPTGGGGYIYIALPGGFYWEFGGLNSAGSGIAAVTFPMAFASGITSSGASVGASNRVVWGPAACTGPPVTTCSWTVTDLSGTTQSGTPVYWWAIGR